MGDRRWASGGSRKKIFGGPGPSSFGRQQRLSEITIEPISGVLLKNIGGYWVYARNEAPSSEAWRGVWFLGRGRGVRGEAPAANAF